MAQADSQNTTAIGGANALPDSSSQTRRGILGAMAGAALVPALPARAQSRTNERLVSLMEEYRVAVLGMCDASNRCDLIAHSARDHYPKRPAATMDTSWGADREPRRYARHELADLRGRLTDGVYQRQIADAQIAELDSWEAECKLVDVQHGVPEADASNEAAQAAHEIANDRLADFPADTVLVVLAKLNAGDCRAHPDDDAIENQNEFNSVLQEHAYLDLWAMAEREDPAATAKIRAILKELYAFTESET